MSPISDVYLSYIAEAITRVRTSFGVSIPPRDLPHKPDVERVFPVLWDSHSRDLILRLFLDAGR